MDPKIAKKTQDTLGKIVKKPPLTEKLLGKPPFRFLHDLLTSVLKTTGFMNGLFTDAELNSENVKDKESKVAFLQKAIDMVCLVNGKQLSVKPNKVVAGHEPEKTNEFLQALADAINKKVNNEEYVKKTLRKGKGGDSKDDDRRREEKKDREKSRDRERDERRERSKDRDRDGGKDRDSDRKDRREKSGRDREERHRDREKRSRRDSSDDDNSLNATFTMVTDQKAKMEYAGKDAQTMPKAVSRDRPRAAKAGKRTPVTDRYKGTEKTPSAASSLSTKTDAATPGMKRLSEKERKSGVKSRLSNRTPEQLSQRRESLSKGQSSIPRSKTSPQTVLSPKRISNNQNSRSPISPKTSTPKKPGESPKIFPPKKTEAPIKTAVAEQRPPKRKPPKEKAEPSNEEEAIQGGNELDEKHRRKSSFTMLSGLENGEHRDEDKENDEEMVNGDVKGEDSQQHSRLQRPTSAKGSRRRREANGLLDTSDEDDDNEKKAPAPADRNGESTMMGDDNLPPQVAAVRKLARPSSARPAPPRPKQDGIEAEPAMRMGSGKPTNLIVDGGGSDEDDTFIVEESAPPPEPTETETKQELDEDAEHGGLVKKILETKKELESGSQPATQKKTEIERPTVSDTQRRKQREQVEKEVNKLRSSIQTLTRNTQPLGRIMDFIQEDLDSMQKEVEKWKTENKEHAVNLKRERSVTDHALDPLKAQLTDLDQAIKDQLGLIGAVKSNILRNDQKIEKMLKSIGKS